MGSASGGTSLSEAVTAGPATGGTRRDASSIQRAAAQNGVYRVLYNDDDESSHKPYIL